MDPNLRWWHTRNKLNDHCWEYPFRLRNIWKCSLVERVVHLECCGQPIGLKRPDKLTSPDCVPKCSSIQTDFTNNSWKHRSLKSLFDWTDWHYDRIQSIRGRRYIWLCYTTWYCMHCMEAIHWNLNWFDWIGHLVYFGWRIDQRKSCFIVTFLLHIIHILYWTMSHMQYKLSIIHYSRIQLLHTSSVLV